MDARITEIEFLSHLERDGPTIEVHAGLHERFGVPEHAFNAMVLTLLCDGAVTGDKPTNVWRPALNEPAADAQAIFWRASERSVHQLLEGKWPYTLQIAHAGRLRLARLRDELDRGRVMDQTGVLVDGRYIERDLRVRLAMLERSGCVCLLATDLDNFKQVNTRLGHPAGTEALERYFTVVRDVVTAAGGDAYRNGGDETLSVLSGLSMADASKCAEAIRTGVATELAYLAEDSGLVPVTVSAGVLAARSGRDAGILIKQADKVLYRAKDSGRDRVVAEGPDNPA